jgi:hypothetical protein
MRLTRLLLAATCALVAAQLAYAIQRGSAPVPTGVRSNVPVGPSGTPIARGGVQPTHDTMSGGDTYVTTRSLMGQVREVNPDEGYIVVTDPKRGTAKFYVGGKTRFRADKDSPLGGRKELTLEDFRKGQTVKVTFWPQNFNATEVRARQAKGEAR